MNRNKVMLLVAALMVTAGAGAQDSRRLLTMEEAVMGTGIRVQNIGSEDWSADGKSLTVKTADEEITINLSSGKTTSKAIEAASGESYAGPAVPGSPKAGRAYTRDNNLFWMDKNGQEHAITASSDPNIVSGQAVSRNEFGINGGIFYSPDSTRIAFYQKDETRVTTFPLLDITTRTGSLKAIKYPMNGMESEIVRVGVYNTKTDSNIWLDVTDFSEERYLTNVSWNPAGDKLYIQVLERAQKNMHLNEYDALTGQFIKTLFTEHDDRYVEPQEPLVFLDNERFIYQTNVRDGYWNMYLGSVKGGEPKRLVQTDADLSLLEVKGDFVYYYSREFSPAEQHLMRVSLKNGKVTKLTRDPGVHKCSISPDGKYFLDNWSSLNVPRVVAAGSTDGKKYWTIFRAPDPTAELNFCPIELGTIKSADGKYDNHYRLIRPLDFDPAKKYPVILYVYGGPHTQLVDNSFHASLRTWEMLMAQRGYVVFVMDNRGTPNHGAEYEKAIHRQCGKAEMEDQTAGMNWLMSFPWVDRERIGIHGWSYGGFMTISLMVNYPEVFKVGVAGGPVIDWKWYEVMYGERYMETEETNPEGFASTSLIPRAKDLKGKLLICQGAIDNTVVWEHSLSFVSECIKEGVQLDYFPYPLHEHNVRGYDRIHLMQKVTDYFETFLK